MPHKAKVLIVDDEPRLCESLRMLLSNHGYEVGSGNSGHEALRRIAEDEFDLILLDIMMPDMDGFQVMEHINRRAPDTLVVVMTGHASAESAITALRVGAYDYLRKPFEFEELLRTIENAVDHKKLTTEHKRIEVALRKAHDDLEKRVEERTARLAAANAMLESEIAERKRAEEALRESSEKIKIFAYSVSHDLKSPAIGIYGLTKLLQKSYREILDEKGRNYCDRILKASEQIAALAEKINIYISAKETPISIERVKLKEVTQMIREEFATEINVRQINWLEPADLPEINADRLCVLRVLRNLLDNALKYGGDGLKQIEIGYEGLEEFHVLSLRDNGIGMKKEDSEKIFGLFKRNETSRGIEGSGLGLAIVKEMAEKHGGEVWAEPGLERGMTFYISFPKSLTPSSSLPSTH
jgi:signal transduction histidine kinase